MQGANPIRIIIVLFIKYSQYCRIATHKKMKFWLILYFIVDEEFIVKALDRTIETSMNYRNIYLIRYYLHYAEQCNIRFLFVTKDSTLHFFALSELMLAGKHQVVILFGTNFCSSLIGHG